MVNNSTIEDFLQQNNPIQRRDFLKPIKLLYRKQTSRSAPCVKNNLYINSKFAIKGKAFSTLVKKSALVTTSLHKIMQLP
eukprot:3896126-Amphidinium_carterae.1